MSLLTRRRPLAVAAVAAAIVFALTGCGAPPVAFSEDAAPMTATEVDRLAKDTDVSAVAKTPPSEVTAKRTAALAWLREKGATGAAVAEMLTKDFPPATYAIPVSVRAATVDGRAVWVVVEAFGKRDQALTGRRLWVFDRTTGQVVRATSYR